MNDEIINALDGPVLQMHLVASTALAASMTRLEWVDEDGSEIKQGVYALSNGIGTKLIHLVPSSLGGWIRRRFLAAADRKQNNNIINNGVGCLLEEEVEQIMMDAKKSKQADKKQRSLMAAKTKLENYTLSIKLRIKSDELQQKILEEYQ
ncbi:heat shock protein 70 [Echinococcus multilocularis]|uniref:Heat shock protein 70 n=1 Tax=Echinococcus multilocularis TaxID=6211 RepID=A0A0S4MLF3_ECHMU|nr:heat shock protein 70 [Echinococcus multilocularis]